tara:strand:- start:162 stop:635 length:474 start_codon:yes stop_codon:yes gene_type:complete
MEMELYGLNPTEHMKATPLLKKVRNDFNEFFKLEKGKQDEYVKENVKYEKANVGAYFRNSVWYWRPLWKYVCKVCNLSTDVYQQGNRNEGYKVDEAVAKDIAVTLFLLLERGEVDRYAKEYSKDAVKCGSSTEYPFDVKNVREFAVFCGESGGFTIC